MTPVEVQCYSGYKADESPRRWRQGDRWLEIAEVQDRWQEAGSRPGEPRSDWFRVRDTAGDQYVLRHDLDSGQWTAGQYRGGGAPKP